MAKVSDVSVGSTIGRLTVTDLKRVPYVKKDGRVKHRLTAVCDCSCGTKSKEILVESLGTLVQACGCLGKEMRKRAVFKHGKSKVGDKTYTAWSAMKQRVFYEKGQHFYLYGGRGVTVSENFVGPNGFESFAKELGEPPTASHSVDRKDPEKGYVEGNLRWATAKEQARNKRNTLWVLYKGEKLSFAALVDLLSLDYQKIYDRYRVLGWALSEAFETKDVTEFKEHI